MSSIVKAIIALMMESLSTPGWPKIKVSTKFWPGKPFNGSRIILRYYVYKITLNKKRFENVNLTKISSDSGKM